MRIGVVGAGAIGGLYGGVLARAGHQVSFLARGEQLRAIQAHGLKIDSLTFGSFVVQAKASENAADLGEADLVLFAVKTYDLDQAVIAAFHASNHAAPTILHLYLNHRTERLTHSARPLSPARSKVLHGFASVSHPGLRSSFAFHVAPAVDSIPMPAAGSRPCR